MNISNRCSLAFALIATISWNAHSADADTKSQANEAVERMSFYRDEASKLSSSAIFKEMERLRNIQALKNQSAGLTFAMDEDSFKSVGYATALEARRKTNEPAGAFFWGAYNWRICGVMQGADKGQLGDAVKNCWLESLESFKVASAGEISGASFNIARLYEKGWGVTPSKLVAAEWFVKAANQYNKDGSREEALTSVEAALDMVPDHPAALRLRNAMLK